MHLPRALPSLRGRRGTAARILYLTIAALAFALTAGAFTSYAILDFQDGPAAERYDFTINRDDLYRPIIDQVWPNAAAAGLLEGERIVAVDGVRIGPGDTMFTAGRLLRAAGQVLTLDLIDNAGRISRHRIVRVAGDPVRIVRDVGLSPWVHRLVRTSNFVILFIVLSVVSIVLFRRRPRDPEAVLLATGFLLMGTDFGRDSWLYAVGLHVRPSVWDWLEMAFPTLGMWCMLVGLCAFPDGRFASRWSRWAWLAPTAYLICGIATNWYFEQFYFPDTVAILIVVTSLFIRYWRIPPGAERQQIKWAALGGAVTIFATFLLAIMESDPVSSRTGPGWTYFSYYFIDIFETLSFPLGLFVSLLRYRLYDADSIITRSAGYVALTVTIIGVFAFVESIVPTLGQDYLGSDLGPYASGVSAAIAAVMIGPLHRRMTEWTERHFRKGLLRFRDDLPLLLGELRETATMSELADAVLGRCQNELHATSAMLVVAGKVVEAHGIDPDAMRTWLTDWAPPVAKGPIIARKDALLPLRIPLVAEGVRNVGWLLLGPRPDGSLYGREERAALAEVADPIARAIAVVSKRIAHETMMTERVIRLEAEIARLNQLFAAALARPVP